jgi:hypothetical protein
MMASEDSNLRERLVAPLAPSSDCATLDALAAFADGTLGASSRARVALHLAGCQRCAAEQLLLEDFLFASPTPEEAATVDWIVDKLRQGVLGGRP